MYLHTCKKCISLFMAFLLSVPLMACHDDTKDQDSAGIDYNQYVNGNGFYAYTDTAWLYYDSGLPVQFIDAGLSHPFEIMCAKPDCHHNTVDCSAYVNTPGIYAWNNHLYYLSDEDNANIGLYEMEIGGENRRQLYAIDEMSELQSYAFPYRIQAGYLLLDLVRYDVSTSADTLYLYPLQDGKNTPVTVFEETDDQKLVDFYLRDDWVFYSVMADDSADRQTLYGYRISTKETKLLHDNWQSKNAISLKENTLYFSKEAEKLCRLDLNSGEITEFEPQLEQAGEYLNYAVAYDDQYFYLMTAEAVNSYGKPGLFIYSYEGELKQFIPYVDGQLLAYCMTGPDVSLFNAPQTGDYAPVCYLDKADIEKGNAEFHFFEG